MLKKAMKQIEQAAQMRVGSAAEPSRFTIVTVSGSI